MCKAHPHLKSFFLFPSSRGCQLAATSCHRGPSPAFNFSDCPCRSHPSNLTQSILTIIPCIRYLIVNTTILNNRIYLLFCSLSELCPLNGGLCRLGLYLMCSAIPPESGTNSAWSTFKVFVE